MCKISAASVVVALLGVFLSTPLPAEEKVKSATKLFRVTPRSPAEKFFLVEEHKSPIDPTNPGLGLGRVAFPEGHFTYRIPLTDVTHCVLNLEIGNRYKISASKDNATWKTLAMVKDVSGLSNYGIYPLDLSSLLPADKVYLKFEDSQNKGWGCWLRSVTVVTDRPKIRPVMFLDVTGQQPLRFNLENVLAKGTKTASPKNHTSVEMFLEGNVLRGRVVCDYPVGYTPVSITKTRDGEAFRDDCVELFIAKSDRPTDYRHFIINSANVQRDELGVDSAYNWQWESKTEINPKNWKADFKIDLEKTGMSVSQGDSLLMCVSRFDGDGGQVPVSVPIANWLHYPGQWAKVLLGDRSAALPALKYNAMTETIGLAKSSLQEKLLLMVMDHQNQTLLADTILPGEPYSRELKFKEPGSYKIYSYSESGLATISAVSVEQETVERFEAELVAPIFYSGEEAKIVYSVPDSAPGNSVRTVILSGNKPIEASVREADGVIHVAGLPVGKYQAVLNLVHKNADKSTAIEFEVRERTTLPAKVEITSAGYIKMDGQPFAPMMVHIPQDFADVKAKGFNVIVTGNDNPQDPEWLKRNLEMLDKAHQSGLKVLLHLCNLLRLDNADYENLKLAVSSLKNHPAIFGWFTADEPSGNVFDVTKLEKAYKVVKAIDDNHPVIVLDNVPIMLKTYAPYCDILSSDPYPVPDSPLEMTRDWTEATLKASTNQCIYMVLQGQGPPYYSRQPTFEEQKIMLQHALDGGAKCIGWWAHGAMASSDYWERFGELTSLAKSYLERTAK